MSEEIKTPAEDADLPADDEADEEGEESTATPADEGL